MTGDGTGDFGAAVSFSTYTDAGSVNTGINVLFTDSTVVGNRAGA